jgi:hypothetical protein
MKYAGIALLFAASLSGQTVCQKFDKVSHTFVDRPCQSPKHPRWDKFWNKLGRDTRETVEVIGVIGLTAGILYVESARGGSSGVVLSSRGPVTAAHK